MRLIDADELMEHAWRDKLDSRELIAKMIEQAPTVKEIPTKIPIDIFEKLVSQEPCDVPDINVGDMISRQAVLDAMYELCDTGETLKENPWRDNPHIDAVVEAIEQLPSVNPQQKPGQWQQDLDGTYLCSECGSGFKEQPTLMGKPMFAWCPLCGAKMVEPQESEVRNDKGI